MTVLKSGSLAVEPDTSSANNATITLHNILFTLLNPIDGINNHIVMCADDVNKSILLGQPHGNILRVELKCRVLIKITFS